MVTPPLLPPTLTEVLEIGRTPRRLTGAGGSTIIADIEGSPARAAILVQQPFLIDVEGPALQAQPSNHMNIP